MTYSDLCPWMTYQDVLLFLDEPSFQNPTLDLNRSFQKYQPQQISPMSFFGAELNTQINKLIFQIRLNLARNKYAPNVRTIYRSCAGYDQQVSGVISPGNFEHALNANGIFLKKYDFQLFAKAFGRDGMIVWFQFLSRLREPMSPLRKELVEHIFDSMDKEKKGSIHPQSLMEHFNHNTLELFYTGKNSKEDTEDRFLSLFSLKEGEISREEFLAYYDDLNINMPHNDIFFRHVSSQWHFTPEKQQAVQEDIIRKETKSLRFKLIEKTQGSKDELLVRKLFDEYDINKNFYLSAFDTSNMLKRLGLEVPAKVAETIHERIDKNNSGYIQFQEFKKFLYYDPYPS